MGGVDMDKKGKLGWIIIGLIFAIGIVSAGSSIGNYFYTDKVITESSSYEYDLENGTIPRDLFLQDNNVTGVNEFRSGESVQNYAQINYTLNDSSGNPFIDVENKEFEQDFSVNNNNVSDMRMTNTTGSLGAYVNDSGFLCYDENCDHYTYINESGVRIDT